MRGRGHLPFRIIVSTLKKRLPGLLGLMAAGILLTVVASELLQRRMEPVLLTYAYPQIANSLREQCGRKVTELLSDRQDYGNILRITSREEGSIVAVYTDTALIGRLKTEVINTLSDSLQGKGMKVSIPLGSLWNDGLFYGRGPCVSLKVSVPGRVQCAMKSEYQSCGINQTKYIMTMNISVEGVIYTASSEKAFSFETDYPISEVILPGYVPDYYSQIDR